MKRKHIYATLVVAISTLQAYSQSNASLPFLQHNPDVRTAAMGDAPAISTKGMAIYTDAASLLSQSKPFQVSYALSFRPEVDFGYNTLNSVALGYRVAKGHAVMAGVRYWGGLKAASADNTGTLQYIYPRDYSIDLGYAFQIIPRLSASARIGYVNSYIGTTAEAVAGSLMLSWRDALPALDYALNLSLDNVGSKLQYGNSTDKVNLPTELRFGATARRQLSSDHSIEVGAGIGKFLSIDGKSLRSGVGIEYRWRDNLGIRVGHHQGIGHSYWTFGAGYDLSSFSINAAYRLSDVEGMSAMQLGLNISF